VGCHGGEGSLQGTAGCSPLLLFHRHVKVIDRLWLAGLTVMKGEWYREIEYCQWVSYLIGLYRSRCCRCDATHRSVHGL